MMTFNDKAQEEKDKVSNVLKFPTTIEEKKKSLLFSINQIEKMYGKGSIVKLTGLADRTYPHIPTGLSVIDNDLLGIGGFPQGRIIEIYGAESSGKTSLALTLIGQSQKLGGICAFIDVEHALDPSWAKKLGVDVDELLVSQPDWGEQALEICEELVRSNALSVIVVDSVAALLPKSELEGDMGQVSMGVLARLMGQAMRKLTAAVHQSNVVLIFINQIRDSMASYGSPVTTPGGRALKFFASVRLEVSRIETLMKGEDPIGSKIRIKAVKNKVAPPFKKVEVDLFYDSGFSRESALIESAYSLGIFKKSGAWWSYKDTKIGQGKENVRQYLLDNPSLYEVINSEVNNILQKQKEEKLLLDLNRRRKKEEASGAQSFEENKQSKENFSDSLEEMTLPIATMADESSIKE
jgi:recombination protein RecA